MSAKDDFAKLKTAAHIVDGTFDSISYVAAFERLFTPKPLKELIAKKVQFAFIKSANGKWHPVEIHTKKHYKVSALDELAIPIIAPQNMGVNHEREG